MKDKNRFQSENNYEKVKKQNMLKSEMYNQDNKSLEKREDDTNDAIMWGFVLGFVLFFILLIFIVVFTR